jgi:hypothetical protein
MVSPPSGPVLCPIARSCTIVFQKDNFSPTAVFVYEAAYIHCGQSLMDFLQVNRAKPATLMLVTVYSKNKRGKM